MMWESEYSRGMNSSYLLVTLDAGSGEDRDSIEMFRYNKIPYFLTFKWRIKDAKQMFSYDITGKRSLDQVLESGDMGFELLQSILNALDQACVQTVGYMLSEDNILLKPEYIFIENGTMKTYYSYLPGNEQKLHCQFQGLMEYLLQHINHKDEQAVQLAYGVYQRVAEEEDSLHQVLEAVRKGQVLLERPKIRRMPQERQAPVSETPYTVSAGQSPDTERKVKTAKQGKKTEIGLLAPKTSQQKEEARVQTKEKIKKLLKKKLYTDNYRDTGEEELVFEESTADEESTLHPTVCLSEAQESSIGKFVYQGVDRTRDFICIQGQLILGSNPSECDICIPSPMVSRIHARLTTEGTETCLEDMNSMNGTRVNGELLKYREQCLLRRGDTISLADEEYCFR